MKIKALLKVLSKRSNVILLISAVAAILGAFGIDFSEASQIQVAELVASLVAVGAIAFGINEGEKEVRKEVEKARDEKEDG